MFKISETSQLFKCQLIVIFLSTSSIKKKDFYISRGELFTQVGRCNGPCRPDVGTKVGHARICFEFYNCFVVFKLLSLYSGSCIGRCIYIYTGIEVEKLTDMNTF